ncbi:MAG TPA: stimulus-sensing domain-containing protein [Thermoanaerobaculia bacterium]|nr:stimulus-sensing domain-containing protein [Thermoanaerobaculia bacterium]
MRFLARISVRLLLFNVLLVFLPAAGFFYLEVYESELLEAQEGAMVQQGRLVAAALAGQGELEAATARALLRRLEGRTESRLRIVDARGNLLADSARLVPARPAPPVRAGRYESLPEPPPGTRENPLYRLGAWLYRLVGRVSRPFAPPEPPRDTEKVYPLGAPLLGSEVRAALAGRYGATIRPTAGQRSVTLYSAIPVRSEDRVVGAVLVSQSTYRILLALYDVRLAIFRVVLAAVVAAAVLSLLVSATIARPLRQLRDEALALVDRRGRLRGRFRGSRRRDEIGDLARALEELTGRLERHLRFTEAFASDVSHELKNPLASIRTATEMLDEVDDPADRRRFLEVAWREVARMEHLLSSVREISRIDARLEAEPAGPVDLRELLPAVLDSFRLRAGDAVQIELRAPAEPVRTVASPDRLAQVFENLLDNAAGFSPPGGAVTVELSGGPEEAVVRVEDRGPGIPEEHRERIFDRFFTWRPGEPQARNGHTGLGLAIVKAIAEGYGGSVAAHNRPDGGARFEVRLPRT